ncbi:nitric oxide synthase [Aquicoccus sp. SCR17]|nr:nitric oxide synthase [Carideicomes alvinocaridis]
MKIQLFYGTETGNSEMLCEDIEAEFGSDHEITVTNLAEVTPGEMDLGTFAVLVCSSYGDGELPASAQPFAEALEKDGTDLTGLNFAIFGLGDSDYDTFGQGSEQLAEMLVKHGAEQVGPRVIHDAQGDELAEDMAFPWFAERVSEAEALADAA